MLEGRGPIIKGGDKIKPMSPAEFAAVLRTLPAAEQQKIEAVIDLFLEDRSR